MSYLDQIAARIEGATKGPWETRINDLTDEVTVVHDSEAVLQVAWIDADYRHTWAMPDAEFIANARVDVPRLLAAVRAVEEAMDDLDDARAQGLVLTYGAIQYRVRRALADALEGER